MTEVAVGFLGNSPRLSEHLGERVSVWLRDGGYTAGTLVLKTGLDKRDAQRVLDGSCGTRAWDRLSATFGWAFVEAIMTPVVGDDPITAREKELTRERVEIAAREARLERLRAATRATEASTGGALRLVPDEDRTWAAPNGRFDGRESARAAEDDGLNPDADPRRRR